MMKRLVCILLSLMLLTAAAFALAEGAATEAPAADVPAADAESADEPPVLLVTVNGKEIYSDDPFLMKTLQYYMSQIDTSDPANLTLAQQYAMNYTILIGCLAREKAAEFGLDQFTEEEKAQMKTDAEQYWDGIVDNFVAEMGNITETSTDDEKAAARADAEALILTQYGVDKEMYVKDYVDDQMESVMLERLVAHLRTGEPVSDEDVQNYFNDLVADDKEQVGDDAAMYEFYTHYYGMTSYYMPAGYRGITHILLKPDQALLDTLNNLNNRWEEQNSEKDSEATEGTDAPETTGEAEPAAEPTPTVEPVTEQMIEDAKKAVLDDVQPKIDEITAKLKAGASFDELIKEYGQDPGMTDEATLRSGYLVHKDSIVWDPDFAAAAMALEKVGDISNPVVTSFGVHILYYLRDVPAGAVELTDAMKDEFRAALQQEQDNETLSANLEKWEQEATIVYTEAGEAWRLPDPEPEESAEETPEEAPADETPAPEETPAP